MTMGVSKKSTNVSRHHETPTGRCGWCLAPVWQGADTCRACRGIETYATVVSGPEHALRGGRWVRRGLTMVWDGPRDVDVEPASRRPVAECGTISGYRRHVRRKEKTCDACKRAQRDDWRMRNGKAAS